MLFVSVLTPCYVIDQTQFLENLTAFTNAFEGCWQKGNVRFGYSIKTNRFPYLLKLALQAGMYAEAVSEEEYLEAVAMGYQSGGVIYNGPQKSPTLLKELLRTESILNLDNFDEIEIIENSELSSEEIKAHIGLRVNFDLEALCPQETTAGAEVSRFGFCVENNDFAAAINRLHAMHIPVSGLHMHFSTKTRSDRFFRTLAMEAAKLIQQYDLKEEIQYVDMGGGFFYGNNAFGVGKPSLDLYASAIAEELKKVVSPQKVVLLLEPGAALISTAVRYYTKILNQRAVRGVKILTVDGSNLDINPFLFKRTIVHDIEYGDSAPRQKVTDQIVCGATCLENDRLLYLKDQPALKSGDILVCHCAGAYSMSFNNCFINLPPYVYVEKDGQMSLVRDKDKEWLTK